MTKRKKGGFLERISTALKESVTMELVAEKEVRKPRKKGFLDTLEDEPDNELLDELIPLRRETPQKRNKQFLQNLEKNVEKSVFDDLFPSQPEWFKKKDKHEKVKPRKPQARISSSIDEDLMQEIRRMAELKQIRIKDILQEALEVWVKKNRN
jgi:hypothetical protein